MYRRSRKENVICNDLSNMEYDEACLEVVNNLNSSITIKRISVACYMCDMQLWQTIDPMDSSYLEVKIGDPIKFGIDSCTKIYSFKQHGVYRWVVDAYCHGVEEVEPPALAYSPLFTIFGLLILFCVLYKLVKLASRCECTQKCYNKLRRRGYKDTAESEISEATTILTNATTQTSEINSLHVPQILCIQVFRGLVILSMFVFYGESSRYWFLRSSPWNGIMPADFVYPWFLWGVGAVLYLKYRSSLLMGTCRLKVMCEVVLRTLKYVVLGVCLNSFEINNSNGLRYPGELQRCGVLHLVIFAVEITTMKKEVEVDQTWQHFWHTIWKGRKFPDRWIQYTLVIVCLVVHSFITYLLPVPGCPTGYTGPGGAHMHSKYPNCTGGAARYIDSLLFGDRHLDQNPLCKPVYKTEVPFDSAGLLGTFNGLLTMFGGVYAAGVFVYYSKTKVRLTILVICGVVQSLLGLLFCLFSEEGGLPLNKQLWSVSFALLTSGTAFLMLALLHVFVDITSLWVGSPLFKAGLNTMLLYAGHTVLRYSLPFSWTPVSNKNYTEFVIMDVITITFWIVASKLAYKHRRIFLI